MPDNSKQFDDRFFGSKEELPQVDFGIGKEMLRRKYLADALDSPTINDEMRGGKDQPTEVQEERDRKSRPYFGPEYEPRKAF